MRFFSFLFFLLLSLPGFSQGDDERTLQELEARRQKQAEIAVKLDQQTHQVADQTVLTLQKMKELGESNVKEFNLSIKEDREELKKLINQNIFNHLPKDLVRSIIVGKVKGRPSEKVFEMFPKILDIMVDMTRNKEAMLGIIGIMDRTEDMQLFGYICIGIAILALIFKKLFIPTTGKGASRLFIRLGFNLAILWVSLGAFYILFEQEVTPIWAVLKKHF